MSLPACTSPRGSSEPSPAPVITSAGQAHFLAQNGKTWPEAERRKPNQPRGLIWRADGVAKGVIVCLHGVQTHAAWFGPLAGELNKAGWTVIAPDRRGSGVNGPPIFTKGHTPGTEKLLCDLSTHLKDAQEEANGKPVLLLGTSWGSNWAGAYAAGGAQPQPRGLIQLVPATALRPAFQPGFFKKLLLGVAGTVLPRRGMPLPFGAEHYLADQSVPGQESANARLKKVLHDDQGNLLQKPTARTLVTGNKLNARWKKGAATLSAAMPVLIITADGDQLMDGAQAAASAPSATHRTLPAGHGAQITHAGEIAAIIAGWAASLK